MAKKQKTSDLILIPKKKIDDDEEEVEYEEGGFLSFPGFGGMIQKDESYLSEKGILFLSGPVTQEKMDKLIQRLLVLHVDEDFIDPVQIVINSPGGDVAAGHAFIDAMDFVKNPIRTIAIGDIASMATYIFIHGQERIMSPRSCAMIHPFSWGNQGSYPHLVAQRKAEDMLIEIHTDMLIRCSKYKKKADVQKLLLKDQDNYLSAQEMLKHGLCDKIFVPGSNKLEMPK